ncbi:MAG: geranylgeranyl reductase family protein [Nitrososphaeria archaeon]
MSQRTFDTLVVGAGTAGAIAALTLAERGGSVLLIDTKEKKSIGKKVCGDALGLHHLKNLRLPFPPSETFKGRVDAIKVYSPSTKYSVTVEGEGLALHRLKFGQWLLDMALDKGVELKDRTRAERISFENGRGIELRVVNTKTQNIEYVRARYFVDASGVNGVLRRQVPDTIGICREIPMQDLCVAYREVREVGKIEEANIGRIFLDEEIAPGGYWWYFPQDEHTLNIGVGLQGGRGINPKSQLKKVLDKRSDLKNSEVLDAGGGLVPTRRSMYTLVVNNILFAGDSACTANPIHGGGIGSSMIAGRACGQAISGALDNAEEERERLWEANRTYIRMYGAKAASLDIFRLFLQTVSNEEIEFGLMKKLVTDEDVRNLGYGTGDLSVRDRVSKVLRGMSRPGMLKNLAETATYMRYVKKEYEGYPDYRDFSGWVERVEGIFREYSNKYLLNKLFTR